MKRFFQLTPAAVAALVALSGSDAFSCDRHIYNNSNCPWTFSATNDAGNLWFTPRMVCQMAKPAQESPAQETNPCIAENGPCKIDPTCVANIQYTTNMGVSRGEVYITDKNGVTKSWKYLGTMAGQCPYVSHSGNTGAVSLNEPADGDFMIGACNW